MAGRGVRFGARTIDLLAGGGLVVVAWLVAGDSERPLAAVAIAWLVLTLYDALSVTWLGTTPGKAAVGLRVVGLDRVDRLPLAQAAKRGAVSAALTIVPLIGWIVWLTSTLTDPLGRGVVDRAASTMVVPDHTPLPIAARDLPGYADGARAPRFSTLGRVGDLDVRMRARLRRLVDAPVLAVAIGLLALAASLPISTGALLIGSSAAWVVVFVVDETLRIHRTGTTAGHRLAGLVVVDRTTAAPPGVGRSLARAAVLGLTLYVPVLWPLLAISMLMVRFGSSGRALHDVAGATVVVADPRLDPEAQRQRAMRMRLGRAA